MRARSKTRLVWFIVGLAVGWIGCTMQYSIDLWPFQNNAFLEWVRWAGKSTIKYSFIALTFAVVLFVIVQLLNYFYFQRELHKDEPKRQ
jgi:hypothetical protein